MGDELRDYLDWLRAHGVRFSVADDLQRDPDHDGPLVDCEEPVRPVELEGLPPFVEHRDPARDIAADHATFSLMRVLLRDDHLPLGCRFWDIGCGTGVLSVAAGLAGARGIVATDVDARALELARRTAAEAEVSVRFCQGSLLEPIPAGLPAQVVAANLPHKPSPNGRSLPLGQAGGPEGDRVHAAFVEQACARFGPGTVVFFFLHSLPLPRLLARYADHFELTLLAWKRRFFGHGEYGALQDYFEERARAGSSYVAHAGDRSLLVAGVWRAVRR